MRNELETPPKEELLLDTPLPPDITLHLAEELVDKTLGPIIHYYPTHQARNEYSDIYQFVTRYQDTTLYSGTGRKSSVNTTGSDEDERSARIKALLECVERYCATLTSLNEFEYASYSDVPGDAVDPVAFNKFSDAQLDSRGVTREELRKAEYHWTLATELVSGESKLIPAQIVYLPFQESPALQNQTSNGAAAHTSWRQAVLGGISEVIERECFVIHFLNELPAPVIDLDTVEDKLFSKYRNVLERKGFTVALFNLTLDQPLKTYLAVGFNEQRSRMIDLGLGAGTTDTEAARDAMRELLQISKWETTSNDEVQVPEDITTLEKRAEYWSGRDPREELDFWLSPDRSSQPLPTENENPTDTLSSILDWIEENEYRCFIADVTSDDIRQQGFKVIKAIIPELHPMYLTRPNRYLDGERLYTAPVEAGLLDEPKAEDELNQTPHPFL